MLQNASKSAISADSFPKTSWKSSSTLVSSVLNSERCADTTLQNSHDYLQKIIGPREDSDPLTARSLESFFHDFLRGCAPPSDPSGIPIHVIIRLVRSFKWISSLFARVSPGVGVSVVIQDSLLLLLETPPLDSDLKDLTLIVAEEALEAESPLEAPLRGRKLIILGAAQDSSKLRSASSLAGFTGAMPEQTSTRTVGEEIINFLACYYQHCETVFLALHVLRGLCCPEMAILFVENRATDSIYEWLHIGDVYERTLVAKILLDLSLLFPPVISAIIGSDRALLGLFHMVTGARAGKRCGITINSGIECVAHFVQFANEQDFLRLVSAPDFCYVFQHGFTGAVARRTVQSYAGLQRYIKFASNLGNIQAHSSSLLPAPNPFLEYMYQKLADFELPDGSVTHPIHLPMVKAFEEMKAIDSLYHM